MKMIEYKVKTLLSDRAWTARELRSELNRTFLKFGNGWLTSRGSSLGDGVGYWILPYEFLSLRMQRQLHRLRIFHNSSTWLPSQRAQGIMHEQIATVTVTTKSLQT